MSNENENENESESCDNSREKYGFPVRNYIASKHETELRRVKDHNNISMKYTLKKLSPLW